MTFIIIWLLIGFLSYIALGLQMKVKLRDYFVMDGIVVCSVLGIITFVCLIIVTVNKFK